MIRIVMFVEKVDLSQINASFVCGFKLLVLSGIWKQMVTL